MAEAARETKFDWQNPRPLPTEFPFYTVDGISAAFSTASGHLHKGGQYLSYYEGQCDLVPREWQKIADGLFFRGGKLADYGIKPKDGIDPAKLRQTISYLLSSWGPKHEEKAATVGFALMNWCDKTDGSPK